MKSPHILQGLNEILEYTGLSKPLFYKFVRLGLPAIRLEGRWYASTVNIDRFFEQITNVSMRNIPFSEGEDHE